MKANPSPSTRTEQSAWLGLCALSLALLLLGLDLFQRTTLKWALAGVAGVVLLLGLSALFLLSLTPRWERLRSRPCPLRAGLGRLWRLRGLAALLLPLAAVALLGAVFFPPRWLSEDELLFAGLTARLGLLGLGAALGGLGLHVAFPRLRLGRATALAALVLGALYRVVLFLPELSPSPFTVGWSEGSRFYYGSLFRAEALYGEPFPLPFLHPSRYLLLSLPFYFPQLPILAHRIWQVLLWLGLTGLTSFLLMRRLRLPGADLLGIGSLGGALFLFQGPLYYHLTLCLIPLLAWFEPRKPLQGLGLVLACSAWAGISRINWWPVPAALALMLWLLETRRAGQGWVNWLRWPLIWGVGGLAAAFTASRGYILLSRQPDASSFSSSFTSDLLWNRLLPSPTYPPGILPMILLLSLPLFAVIGLSFARGRLGGLRNLGLAALTLVMLGGGLVVSTKIGGGSNLHNLDAYLALLLVWGAYLLAARAVPEDDGEPFTLRRRGWPIQALALALPLVPLLQGGLPLHFPDQGDLRAEAEVLRARVRAARAEGGSVLFIWQRQFLTFELAGEVPLIYPYETVDLMEMAMADNRPYLEDLYRRLEAGEFALIISGVENDNIRPASDPFSEENNVWVEQVTRPLLRWYSPAETLPVSGTQILEPRR